MSHPVHEFDRDRFFKQLQSVLPALHDLGVVNEEALLAVLLELVNAKPLTLDHLTAIFGVDRIYALISTPRQDADRAHLRRELDDIFDLLNTAEPGSILSANLRLVTLLRDELVQRPRWWSASQAAPSTPST